MRAGRWDLLPDTSCSLSAPRSRLRCSYYQRSSTQAASAPGRSSRACICTAQEVCSNCQAQGSLHRFRVTTCTCSDYVSHISSSAVKVQGGRVEFAPDGVRNLRPARISLKELASGEKALPRATPAKAAPPALTAPLQHPLAARPAPARLWATSAAGRIGDVSDDEPQFDLLGPLHPSQQAPPVRGTTAHQHSVAGPGGPGLQSRTEPDGLSNFHLLRTLATPSPAAEAAERSWMNDAVPSTGAASRNATDAAGSVGGQSPSLACSQGVLGGLPKPRRRLPHMRLAGLRTQRLLGGAGADEPEQASEGGCPAAAHGEGVNNSMCAAPVARPQLRRFWSTAGRAVDADPDDEPPSFDLLGGPPSAPVAPPSEIDPPPTLFRPLHRPLTLPPAPRATLASAGMGPGNEPFPIQRAPEGNIAMRSLGGPSGAPAAAQAPSAQPQRPSVPSRPTFVASRFLSTAAGRAAEEQRQPGSGRVIGRLAGTRGLLGVEHRAAHDEDDHEPEFDLLGDSLPCPQRQPAGSALALPPAESAVSTALNPSLPFSRPREVPEDPGPAALSEAASAHPGPSGGFRTAGSLLGGDAVATHRASLAFPPAPAAVAARGSRAGGEDEVGTPAASASRPQEAGGGWHSRQRPAQRQQSEGTSSTGNCMPLFQEANTAFV